MSQNLTATQIKLIELRRQKEERRRQEEEEERRLEEEARREQEEMERREREERERLERQERERREREEREQREQEEAEKKRVEEEKARAAATKPLPDEVESDGKVVPTPKLARKQDKGKKREVADHVAVPTKRQRVEDTEEEEEKPEKRKRAPRVKKDEVKRGEEFPCELCERKGFECKADLR
jgi:trichohyalin